MIDLSAISYITYPGIGAILGIFIGIPVIAILGFIWPLLWSGWIFAPTAFGTIAGLIYASIIK